MRVVTIALVFVALAACERGAGSQPEASETPTYGNGDRGNTARIVSLSPAISQALALLGCSDCVVGRTPWCLSLPESIPIAGSLREIDAEALLALGPTLVLAQWEGSNSLDDELSRVCEFMNIPLRRVHVDSLSDVREMVALVATLSCAQSQLAAQWTAALAEATLPMAQADIRTLIISEGDAYLAFGRHTYVSDLLECIGGRNAIERTGYPSLTVEDLLAIQPEMILFVGASPADAAALDQRLVDLGMPEVPRGARTYAVDSVAFTPGPGVLQTARSIRASLLARGAVDPQAVPDLSLPQPEVTPSDDLQPGASP
ncbi:MAG: hypothetical protein EXS00_07970 [Phycisphaerales bacterium]|nr:hypothetical protein [Phycisphaerales bacterium]